VGVVEDMMEDMLEVEVAMEVVVLNTIP